MKESKTDKTDITEGKIFSLSEDELMKVNGGSYPEYIDPEIKYDTEYDI